MTRIVEIPNQHGVEKVVNVLSAELCTDYACMNAIRVVVLL